MRRAPSTAVALKLAAAFALSGVAAYLILSGGSGATPPVARLLLAGSVISVLTLGALYWGVRTDLRLPARVAAYAVAFNALVVLTKFVLAPKGFYEVNQHVALNGLLTLDDAVGASLTAAAVFVLYLVAYVVVYRLCRRRLTVIRELPDAERGTAARRLVVLVLAAAFLLAGTGGSIVLLLPLALFDSLEYLEFVFSSGMSLLVGLALAGATWLSVLAFRSAAARAEVLGDAALLVGFFWLGLYFLALYHALWVVYVLILTSTWPLKVVVPK